jgi:Flp pilus assembly protein TadD
MSKPWRALGHLFQGIFAKTTETEVDCLVQGDNSLAQGNYEQAIAVYSKAIEINPQRAHGYIHRGMARFQIGDRNGAIEDFSSAIDIEPNNDNAYCSRGIALQDVDFETASVDFARAIEINPDNDAAYYNRGVARVSCGDFDAGIADCTKAIDLNPDRANAYYTRGNAWREKGELDRAIADYDKAIALNPDDVSAHNNRGMALLAKGDIEAALADFQWVDSPGVQNAFYGRDGITHEYSYCQAPDSSGSKSAIACLVQWHLPTGGSVAPGFAGTEILGGLLGDKKVFVIWGDRREELDACGVNWNDSGVRYSGDFCGAACECVTSDGKSGIMRLAGQSYSLADGAFFLISNRDEKLRVLQLRRDLAPIRYEERHFRELAESDEEIRTFFGRPHPE